VKVSELKAGLSGYLAQVRRGATVTVCDRRTPIARLVPFDGDVGGLEVQEPVDGHGLPAAPRIALRKAVDVVALLRADREPR
jgi:prevent-host-death family protein